MSFKEIWKPIPRTNHAISNTGKLAKVQGFENSKQLVPIPTSIDHNGYEVATIYYSGKKKNVKIHRLVAQAFLTNPKSKKQVNHIDGNKLNNNLSNLEWCTNSENQIHAYRTGLNTAKSNEDHPFCKLSNNDIKNIRILCKSRRQVDIARLYGINQGTVSKIKNGKIRNINDLK